MNVLLIGLGRWGEKHLRVLRELGCEVWVADLSPARRAWAEKQGVPPTRVSSRYQALDRSKESLAVGTGEPLRLELAAFLSACAGSGPNLAPAEAGAQAVAVVEAASRSAALGRLVSLDEIG